MPSRARVDCSLRIWAAAAANRACCESATIIRPTWTDRVTPILDIESRKKFRRNLLARPGGTKRGRGAGTARPRETLRLQQKAGTTPSPLLAQTKGEGNEAPDLDHC